MSLRQRLSLDGKWDFQIDLAGQDDVNAISTWRQAQVPQPWQAQFADLRHTSGVGWYKRTFHVDRPSDAVAAMLHFGAVDYHSTVWVNGVRIGEHEGGYLPFAFDISTVLRTGENEIVVRVADPTENPTRWPQYRFSEIPHGKQSWYGPISGIWQSVWLEWCAPTHLRDLRLTPLVAEKRIEVAVRYHGELPDHVALQLQVTDPNGAIVATTTLPTPTGGRIQLDSTPLALWSPQTPALYQVTATLQIDGQSVDTLRATCGFRTIEAKDGRIYLNGEPIYLRGVLDQAYYPETIYTPPSLEFLEDQLHKAKALGLNCLRCHIKIEDPRYYEVADRLGILIWTEIPNWDYLSASASQRAKETFIRMVERDWNHPSIIAWTLINENWGTDLARNAEHRHWLAEFYHEAKQIDPYRLIVDNSACGGNFHVAGDLEDYHDYRAIPDHAADWDEWVADFAGHADWAWAADYRHERRADLPLIVSEFGNWGLPDPAQIQEGGQDPWWFENGQEWGEGIVYPHQMTRRFGYWGLADVFGDFAAFIRNQQEHMARSLAYEITTMRLHTAVGGYVITEFTDVHWECNGLLDMQRHVKAGLDSYFTPLNQDCVVVVRPQQWSGRPGEQLAVEMRAYGVDGEDGAGRIHWQTSAAQGAIDAPGGVVQIPLTTPGLIPLDVTWRAADGGEIARCKVELACVAPTIQPHKLHVLDDPTLAGALAELGYTVVTEEHDDVIYIAHHYAQTIQDALQAGCKVLLLAGPDFVQGEDTLRLPVAGVVARAGTAWQGDWATSFSWLRKEGPFAALPGDPLLEMEYAEIMPDAVIAGIPAWAYRERSWAGLALGWIHKPVSLLAYAPYGSGELVITTFKLNATTITQNVLAQAIFAGCVDLLA
ncbi:MAG: glycoside hydrolase family 2 TIM barrel-domain containing protein [Caldilineaceae bacterium]